MDGSDAATTLEFSLDGVAYAIDLSEDNAERLRTCLEPYIGAARKIGRRRVRTNWLLEQPQFEQPPFERQQSHHQRAREWLRMNGHKVGDRGRLPQELLQTYELAEGVS